MGSLNLGRIKGEKGDRGETGAKGDTGAKGEKGEKGDDGRDGLTPVFSIGEVVTLRHDEDALVELDTTIPSNPVLSFRIPSGKDGKDALGDMMKAVYDTEGIGTDIYEYARNLFEKCLNKQGGNLSGSLVAAESALSERAVRNISVADSLPETGLEGDIFILMKSTGQKNLGECNEGEIVIIKEKGEDTAYIVAGINYHGNNTVTLIRKDLSPARCYYDYNRRGEYMMSDVDIFLETMYTELFDNKIKGALIPIKRDSSFFRRCFILEKNEYTSMSYFSVLKNRAAYRDNTAIYETHITASAGTQSNIISINQSGEFASTSTQSLSYVRPVIVLPAEFPVINTEYESTPAVKPSEILTGIYVRAGEEWKECALS